ncbi:unnamed protein product [Eruca vesicaria subsp. sativa]|uniref:Bifunctional inhibitor/plant lipid transfer protein/seed storage helical domain-containing protein n=1 Tax=Eruca vesicaria subsp. sativa TaxID=29727 RepID=A0ABC8LNZ8_ERUVS|nr:unnamed protein product [Eruca vesicaria subsp. sativa]
MANKLFIVSATLAFFFLLTNASIYRTVVEFEEDDATDPIGPFRPPQKCQKEFQQSQNLRACQQWIHKQAMKPHVGPAALDGDFEDDMENPHGPQERPPLLQQCCNELHQEDTVCVCPSLKHASKEVRYQVQQRRQQVHPQIVSRIYQTAAHLPSMCNVQQVSVCPFQPDMSFPPYY